MSTIRLSLYYSDSCSYCWQVMRAVERYGLAVELRDVDQNPHFREELVSARGRGTVPVLRVEDDEGVTLVPESIDVIRYLRDFAGDPDPVPGWVDRGLRVAQPLALGLFVASFVVQGAWSAGLAGLGLLLMLAVLARRMTV